MKVIIEIEANKIVKRLITEDGEFVETTEFEDYGGLGRRIIASESIIDQVMAAEIDIDEDLLRDIDGGDIDFIESRLSELA